MSHLSYHLAQALTERELQVARANHRPAAPDEPVKRLASGRDDHERQRALVRASLLVSRRRDAPTHRRWA